MYCQRHRLCVWLFWSFWQVLWRTECQSVHYHLTQCSTWTVTDDMVTVTLRVNRPLNVPCASKYLSTPWNVLLVHVGKLLWTVSAEAIGMFVSRCAITERNVFTALFTEPPAEPFPALIGTIPVDRKKSLKPWMGELSAAWWIALLPQVNFFKEVGFFVSLKWTLPKANSTHTHKHTQI